MFAIYERDSKAGTPEYEHIKTYYPDDWERHDEAVQDAIQHGQPYSFDIRTITEKGNEKFIRVEGRPVKDDNGKVYRLHGTAMDITNRKIQERKLQDSLQEKETLLMEIHHRVKNNLAVVSGLMQLQALNSDNEELSAHLNDSVSRIKTIASIHELLYKSDNFSKLDADEVAKKLIRGITQTFKDEKTLHTKFKLQSVKLNINQAIPLSLIINEVVTNIFKHAFTGKDQGTLTVFICESNGKVELKITDNGKGLPKGFPNILKKESLGLQLIETLSEQLEADYKYETENGETNFILTFEKREIKGSSSALI
jgi:two-component sensor histidine kinase